MWRDPYETDDFVIILENLWEEIQPLYQELHTYVRRYLEQRYPEMDVSDGLLPANVFGT